MTYASSLRLRACAALASALTIIAGTALADDDLCGRPRAAPDALYQLLTKTEGLVEAFRDKSYVTVKDAAKATIWTFTVPGHPAHPAAICRHIVEEAGKLRIEMGVQCNGAPTECARLVRGFEALNARLLKDAEGRAQ
jgi:hypothetical protein